MFSVANTRLALADILGTLRNSVLFRQFKVRPAQHLDITEHLRQAESPTTAISPEAVEAAVVEQA
jgi:hypothetical protein